MQFVSPLIRNQSHFKIHGGWLSLALLFGALAYSVIVELWRTWRGDFTFSHGPIIVIVAAALLWKRRTEFQAWDSATLPGLLTLSFSAALFLVAVWADVAFLKPLSLISMIVGATWFLGGRSALRVSICPLGLLVFMIPWPTVIIDRLAFPLQLLSSTYAAMLGGMLGLPLIRNGVQVSVVPNVDAPPVYSMIVAGECSGLSSLMVLLALGYLAAYFTNVKIGWRALLLACVVPMALFINVIRLTVILFFGTYSRPEVAQWVHDNEGPVLILLCSFGLLGIRNLLVTWLRPQPLAKAEG